MPPLTKINGMSFFTILAFTWIVKSVIIFRDGQAACFLREGGGVLSGAVLRVTGFLSWTTHCRIFLFVKLIVGHIAVVTLYRALIPSSLNFRVKCSRFCSHRRGLTVRIPPWSNLDVTAPEGHMLQVYWICMQYPWELWVWSYIE